MSKRAAEVQLTADTVEGDEEEERGEFQVASEQQLQARVIKKAKRGRTGMQTEGAGLFSGVKLTMNGTTQPSTTHSHALLHPPAPSATPLHAPLHPPAPSPPHSSHNKYLEQLRSLNISVSEWITQHVRQNPFVDLTPIFRDYEVHLKNIDSKTPTTMEGVAPSSSDISEGEGTRDTEGSQATVLESQPSECTEGSQATDSQSQASQSEEDSQPTEFELQPSKSEVTEDSEDDSLFSVRAKLFYKKEDSFTELGIGRLRVQLVSSGGNGVRLLLRNDTKLGTILLNVRVTADIPVTAKGNNVFVVCVPNPPLSKEATSTPVTYLLRVKTAQAASDLVKTIKEH